MDLDELVTLITGLFALAELFLSEKYNMSDKRNAGVASVELKRITDELQEQLNKD